ncbi:MAG: VWA domain-containing protein [Endomicrobiales bacterium]|nr:VWA domain-containing protein [Endomicrobiales bacterium]
MRFANPLLLLLLLLIPLLIWEEFKRQKRKRSAILFSDASLMRDINPSPKIKLRLIPIYLRFIVLFLVILSLARPQSGQKSEEIYNQGIDIMLILDTSSSMGALDFNPDNRLTAAKKVAADFIKGRSYDRIGIVVFAGLAYTQCPLTIDHEALLDFLDQIEIGMTQIDATAIGSAIATAAARLKNSTGKSKVIILLTDGRNNFGEIDPVTASQAASAIGIRIYPIGAGKPGETYIPIEDPVFGKRLEKIKSDLDETTLLKIADETKGRYFRATDTESLRGIFREIDQMEKTEIKTLKYTNYTELFGYFLWPGIFLLGLEILLANTWLRKIP